MPGKYKIEAEYRLSTQLEPEGRLTGIEDDERALEYDDTSSFYGDEFTAEGGSVEFVVEATGEEDARVIADDLLGSASYSGDGYFEWEVSDYRITSVEEIEPPMDLERALEIIRAYFGTAEGLTDEQRAAFVFMLERITP